jgi:hypothetical protein
MLLNLGYNRVFPVDQKKLNSLIEKAPAYHRRDWLNNLVYDFTKEYSHPLFEYCAKHALASCQKLEENAVSAKKSSDGNELIDHLEELLFQQSQDPIFLKGLNFRL